VVSPLSLTLCKWILKCTWLVVHSGGEFRRGIRRPLWVKQGWQLEGSYVGMQEKATSGSYFTD
jgi:hypothetical protein